MLNSSAVSQINDSDYGRKSSSGVDQFLTETQNENDVINIKEELLILRNGTNVDISGQVNGSSKHSLTSNLYIDATRNYQSTKFIKKENSDPVAEQNSDVLYKGKINLPGQDLRYEIITPDLKREPMFVNTEENISNFVNPNGVSDVFRRKTVYIKQERTDSDNDFSNEKTDSVKSNTIASVKEEVQEKFGAIKEKPSYDDNKGIVYDMDEQNDSFNEEMSCSEEEVNSSDIEEMFSESKINQSLKCLTCGKLFQSEKILHRHVLSHTNDGLKKISKFECETCGKVFKRKHHLKRHYLSHTTIKEFACAHCEKSYRDKHDLTKHLASNHTVKECSVCGKTFDNSLKLKKHHAVHKKSERKFETVVCHICQKTFQGKKYLKRHLQVHAKMTRFACNLCNKSFLYPFLLQEHIRSHTGERPFECDKCDRKFSTKSNLVRHLGTHLKTKSCKNCSAEFEDEKLFNAHKKSCVLSYECGKCGLTCDRISNLRRHMKKTHANGEDSIDSDSENIIVRIV